MAKAKQKVVYIRYSDEMYGDDYMLYRKKSQAISDIKTGHHGYESGYCKDFFERATGFKLKDGEVVELILKRGKTVRKAS